MAEVWLARDPGLLRAVPAPVIIPLDYAAGWQLTHSSAVGDQ